MKDIMLILHFLGLTMGLGTGVAHIFIGISAAKMSSDDGNKLKLQSQALDPMGSIGTVLLLVSGIYLIIPYWDSLLHLPLLMLKLFLVLVLLGLIAAMNYISKKTLKQDIEIGFKKLELLGKITLVTSISIVVVAVLMFH